MMKNVRNKKGQVGEILVIVVLIILAVLGVMKYVMPMFTKSEALSGKASGQVDSVMTATNVQNGQVVSGASLSSIWAQLCSQTNPADVDFTNISGGGSLSGKSSTKGAVFPFTGVKNANNYKITITSYHENGEINVIEFKEQ